MCYVIVKDINKHGCVAYKTKIGKSTSILTRKLNDAAPRRGIQVVTISRPLAFGEYAPYSFVKSEEELLKAVKEI